MMNIGIVEESAFAEAGSFFNWVEFDFAKKIKFFLGLVRFWYGFGTNVVRTDCYYELARKEMAERSAERQ